MFSLETCRNPSPGQTIAKKEDATIHDVLSDNVSSSTGHNELKDEEIDKDQLLLCAPANPTQAQDYFALKHCPQHYQFAFDAPRHYPPAPHQGHANFYQPPAPTQYPITYQPQPTSYLMAPPPQYQPFPVNQPASWHPQMQASLTWTQQPMPPAYAPYPYPSYAYLQPYPWCAPAPGFQPPVLSSKPEYSSINHLSPKDRRPSQLIPPKPQSQAMAQRQQGLTQTESMFLAPVPQALLSNAQLPFVAKNKPTPKPLPEAKTPAVPISPDQSPRFDPDRDRDTLGVSKSADQNEIRAAYWEREFEYHPARHRMATSAFQAVMAEKLVKAQEAVDRLGGFAGISYGAWEGLEEYSNFYTVSTIESDDG